MNRPTYWVMDWSTDWSSEWFFIPFLGWICFGCFCLMVCVPFVCFSTDQSIYWLTDRQADLLIWWFIWCWLIDRSVSQWIIHQPIDRRFYLLVCCLDVRWAIILLTVNVDGANFMKLASTRICVGTKSVCGANAGHHQKFCVVVFGWSLMKFCVH